MVLELYQIGFPEPVLDLIRVGEGAPLDTVRVRSTHECEAKETETSRRANADLMTLQETEQGYNLTSLGLQALWDHLSGGSALFVLILHFYGPRAVLYFNDQTVAEVLKGAEESAKAQLLSTTTTVIADMIHSGKGSAPPSPSPSTRGRALDGQRPLRVDPLLVYRNPLTAQQKEHNLVYIFKLWNATGIDMQWTRLTDWMSDGPDPDFFLLQLWEVYRALGNKRTVLHCEISQSKVKDKKEKQNEQLDSQLVTKGEQKEASSVSDTRVPFADTQGQEEEKGPVADNESNNCYGNGDDDDDENDFDVVIVYDPHHGNAYVKGVLFGDDVHPGVDSTRHADAVNERAHFTNHLRALLSFEEEEEQEQEEQEQEQEQEEEKKGRGRGSRNARAPN